MIFKLRRNADRILQGSYYVLVYRAWVRVYLSLGVNALPSLSMLALASFKANGTSAAFGSLVICDVRRFTIAWVKRYTAVNCRHNSLNEVLSQRVQSQISSKA